jgi:hypothetical protein
MELYGLSTFLCLPASAGDGGVLGPGAAWSVEEAQVIRRDTGLSAYCRSVGAVQIPKFILFYYILFYFISFYFIYLFPRDCRPGKASATLSAFFFFCSFF